MERRTSYRKAIHHEAVVCLQGGAKWPCVISDFCDQGMFLTYELTASKAIKAELSMSPTQVFSLRFLGPKGVHYEVAVEEQHVIHIHIEEEYQHYIASTSHFYNNSGFNVKAKRRSSWCVD